MLPARLQACLPGNPSSSLRPAVPFQLPKPQLSPLSIQTPPHPPQEWERLRQLGMTAGLGEDEGLDLQCLDAWCRSAASDMLLLEALQVGGAVAFHW